MRCRGVRRDAFVGRELGDEHGVYVLLCVGIHRGHLRMEHELCDGHDVYVLWSVGVQRGHLRVGHELCDGFDRHVLGSIGVDGVVRTT